MAMSRIGCGAALAWTLGVCAALATPAIAGGGGPADEPVYRGVIVSGADMTRNADEAYTGAYYAFNGDLSREGFILRLFGTRGFYDYRTIDNDGNYWQGDLMVGYQWVRGRVDVGVYVGVDYQNYDIAVPDPFNKLNGSETGFKVAFDLEFERPQQLAALCRPERQLLDGLRHLLRPWPRGAYLRPLHGRTGSLGVGRRYR